MISVDNKLIIMDDLLQWKSLFQHVLNRLRLFCTFRPFIHNFAVAPFQPFFIMGLQLSGIVSSICYPWMPKKLCS